MMNIIWLGLILVGVTVAAFTGKASAVTDAAFAGGKLAIETMLGLAGLMALWMGIMKIAEKAGLMEALAALLRPVVRALFPSVPGDHPAIGAMIMNIAANMLGLGSAATPFGLKAMAELQALNEEKETASEAMCTFLTLNTASITLVPGTIIALRATYGSANPAEVVMATLAASTLAGIFAVGLDGAVRAFHRMQGR